MAKIREVYALYGFEAVETPFVEYTEALGKFLPDQDRPNEGVFSFKDDDEQWLSLRYDLTAPLARYVAENSTACPSPIAAIAPAGCSATKSRGRAASASSCSSTPTRSARPRGRRRRDLHDGRRLPRSARDQARRLCHQGQQPQGARRRDGGDRPRRGGERRAAARRCCARSTSSTGSGPTACARCSARGARTRAAIHQGRRAEDASSGAIRRERARPTDGRRGFGDESKATLGRARRHRR